MRPLINNVAAAAKGRCSVLRIRAVPVPGHGPCLCALIAALLLAGCQPALQTQTEDFGNALEKQDLIRVDRPQPNDVIRGTVTIEGKARGTWYFEASFPLRLIDDQGKELIVSHAEAERDWMTEDFVPFSATITVPETTAERGTLILEKDNPSGLPEHADELRIPLQFR